MKHSTLRQIHCCALLAFLICLCACSTRQEISDFKSDGCSLFPDRSLILNADWCESCFQHDLAYWKGGAEAERLAADQALRDSVLAKTGNAELAEFMYHGVRFGGSPYFYNWYRWGYGWSYDRKYQALTDSEKAQVAEKLEKYYASNPKSPCSGNE